MELIWNKKGNELEKLTMAATPKCSSVRAAIAYATDDRTLLEICHKHRKPLTLYARYDFSGPVSDVVSRWFLSKERSADYELLLVPDIFHPKVIWWNGVGVYIGSANLSKAAWTGNIEAGVFLTEHELIDSGMYDELDSFFDQIKARATSLTRELAADMTNARSRAGKSEHLLEKEFEATRHLPRVLSVISITKIPGGEKRRKNFLSEWNQTLQHLRKIGERLTEPNNLPEWIPPTPPAGVLTDQFLHAVYYNRVRDGQPGSYNEWYKRNRESRERALADCVQWWSELPSAPSSEDDHILRWAPVVRSLLDPNLILSLSPDQFVQLCTRIHAVADHARRLNHETFGLEHELPNMTQLERVHYFARWLYRQRSGGGHSPLELFHHVLYGGAYEDAPLRLFDASNDPEWKIPHIGVSTLGEIIGWAMPDEFPPRNGRTSKALRALGYDVRIHSE